MSSKKVVLPLFLAVALSACLHSAPVSYYVSPGGSDGGPGTKRKPFATLLKVRDTVRALPPERRREGVKIHLAEGIHTLTEPLVLTPEDSGISAEAPVIWSGESGAVISGGRRITGWTEDQDGIWKAEIAWLGERDLFYSLFADDRRLVRARTPDSGSYHYTRQLIFDKESGNNCTGMFYHPETIPDDIKADGAHIVLFHKWVTSQNFIDSIDTSIGRILFTRPAGIFLFTPESRFYVEGVRSALTAPGEWFLDRRAHAVYLIPPEGKNPNRMRITAPVLKRTLVQIKGSGNAGDKVRHLVFENISFEHADAELGENHPKSVQGAHFQRGAFTAEGLHDSIIRNCTFTRIGENGITLLNGCRNNLIEQNHIYDMGCGGIYMPEQKPSNATPDNLCGHNIIRDNLIHDGGHIFRAGVGIFLGGNASYNRILHNEIFNLSWMGIHAGWSWSGLVPTATHHNEIGYNHIHHIGNGVLCDIGGIYTIGVSPGTVLHNNRIHDVTRYTRGQNGYGGWGIYLDAGSSQITVASNLVYNTQDGGFHLHNDNFPWGDRAFNNIFAVADAAQLKRNNIDDTTNGLHLVFENNIVFCTNNLVYGGYNWKTNSAFSCDYNCFYSTDDQPLDFAGHDFKSWQSAGKDVHSVIADPLFRDLGRRDFRLDPRSPAIALGFKPFDYTLAGLSRNNPLRKEIGRFKMRVVETAPAETRTFSLDETFEHLEPGSTPLASHTTRQLNGKGFLVTTEKAAAGKQSLKIADSPDFQYSYDPHICYYTSVEEGIWRISFDLYHVGGAEIIFETRDWPAGQPLKSGPAIRIGKEGKVTAGSANFSISSGEWSSFLIECTQGPGTWPTWNLTVNANRPDEKKFLCLPTNPGFISLNWLGFISPDKSESVYYIDNLKVEKAGGQ